MTRVIILMIVASLVVIGACQLLINKGLLGTQGTTERQKKKPGNFLPLLLMPMLQPTAP